MMSGIWRSERFPERLAYVRFGVEHRSPVRIETRLL
jgi:hypothetical protein